MEYKHITSFEATLFKNNQDEDGQYKLTFRVPMNQSPSMLRMALCIKTVLRVTVEQEQ